MKTQRIVTVVLVVVALLFAGLYFTKPVNQNPVQPDLVAGGTSGPDRFNPCESTDGITSCFTRVSMNQASTTACAIQGPSATSTMRLITVKESVSTTTASLIEIGISSNPTATTTPLGSLAVSANNAVFMAISTSTTVAPNNWVVVNQKAGPGLTVSPTGFCQATFTIF